MSRQATFAKYDVLGVEIDAATIDGAISYIMQAAANPTDSLYVVKPYVEFLDAAARDPRIRTLLNQSQLCLPDGIALVWATHYKYGGPRTFRRWLSTIVSIVLKPHSIYTQLPDRFGGTNFTWPLLQAAATHNLRIFLIGSPRHNSIEHTARFLRHQIPNLQIAGTFTGHFDGAGKAQLMDMLGTTKPDLILVGMGFPKQEILIAEAADILPHGVFIGEGGTFDYQQFGGRAAKAPAWLQRLGLEWLFRLIRQPSRITRQLAIPRFMWRVYRER